LFDQNTIAGDLNSNVENLISPIWLILECSNLLWKELDFKIQGCLARLDGCDILPSAFLAISGEECILANENAY
jgi:hypothetical protein